MNRPARQPWQYQSEFLNKLQENQLNAYENNDNKKLQTQFIFTILNW